jgi:SAM-dependent methyltransferase
MSIDWTIGGTSGVLCPACRDTDPKPVMLSVPSARPPRQDLPLALCRACDTAFFPTLEAVAYEGLEGAEEALAFYLEQGAGIDAMVETVEVLAHDRACRYLEIGCGYGLSLDYARKMFGWEVRGVDPGFGAVAGKLQLGLDIIEGYLRSPADVAPLPYDIIMCSEILEHVPDPDGFLSVIPQILTPGGTLILTTPNAALIAKDTPSGTLIPLLSPGYHVVLYSRKGLEAILKRVGFTSVSVVERGPTLRAAASMGRLEADLESPLNRARYLDYLGRRADEIPANSPLALGLRYRQLKELTHAGEYALAEKISGLVGELCRQRWGNDFMRPEDFVKEGAPLPDLRSYHALYPFCLCGILYFRSMLAWRQDNCADFARKGFLAAAGVGERLRALLLGIGADDGETEELAWRALGHAAHAVAATDPGIAAREAKGFGHTRSPVLSETMPALIAVEMRRAVFVTLVNFGHGTQAAQLADDVAAEAPGSSQNVAPAFFALGILALNHSKDPKNAVDWFAKAHAASRPVAEQTSGEVQSLLWLSLYHEALALVQIGERRAAESRLRCLVGLPPSGLPEVTPELNRRACELARNYNLSI